MIHTAEEAWSVNTDINKALLELNHRAGGPVHINLETTYSPDFSVEKLPETRVIHRVMPQDEFPAVPQGKIAIWIGSHRPFSLEVTQLIEQFCEQYNAVVVGDHTSNYRGKYYANMHLSRSQDVWGESVCQKVDLLIHLGDVSGGYLGVQSQAVWRVHPDGRVCDTFQQLRRIFEMDEKTFFTKILAQGKGQVKTDFARACQQEHEEFPDLVEALSGLPLGCCIGFMLPVCAIVRFLLRTGEEVQSSASLGLVVAAVFAPLQEAWLSAWGTYGGGSAFVRFVASALPAAVAGAILFSILPKIERFAGLREEVEG